jgi:TRAP-type C4-dicarboxylate transport system permease small subunit
MTNSLFLAPEGVAAAVLPVLVVLAALALILQLRRVAFGLAMAVGLIIFAPLVLDPLCDMLLAGVPQKLVAPVLLVGAVILALLVLQRLVALIFGRETASHVVGTLFVDILKFGFTFAVLGPLRICGWGIRVLGGSAIRQIFRSAVRMLSRNV